MASFTASSKIIHLLRTFAPALTRPAFSKAVTLFCGVILSPGRRTVAAALRAVGLQDDQTFGKYHRLLSRDRWSALLLSKQLLQLLVQAFIEPDQRIDLVVDETLERRQGKKIVYKSWYRDAVRSTHNVVVTVLGVRWLCFSRARSDTLGQALGAALPERSGAFAEDLRRAQAFLSWRYRVDVRSDREGKVVAWR